MIIFHIEMVKDLYSREHVQTWEHMLMHSTLSTCYDEPTCQILEYFLAGNTTHSSVGKGKTRTGKWIPYMCLTIILVPVIAVAWNRSTIGTFISQCESLHTCSLDITLNTTLNNCFSVSSKVVSLHGQHVEERSGKGVSLNCLSI